MDTSKPISGKELAARFAQGAPVVNVEYRSSVAETITWRDRESQKAMTAPMLRHTVEAEGGALIVDERTFEDFDPLQYKPPFRKGQRVALWFTEWKTERGMVRARGTLQPIADNA